jgi:hypothetical protein
MRGSQLIGLNRHAASRATTLDMCEALGGKLFDSRTKHSKQLPHDIASVDEPAQSAGDCLSGPALTRDLGSTEPNQPELRRGVHREAG